MATRKTTTKETAAKKRTKSDEINSAGLKERTGRDDNFYQLIYGAETILIMKGEWCDLITSDIRTMRKMDELCSLHNKTYHEVDKKTEKGSPVEKTYKFPREILTLQFR